MTNNSRRILLSMLTTASITAAWAIPPRTTPYLFTQPDGTKLEVKISGAPRNHQYTLAETDIPLVRDGETFFFAKLDNSGNVVSSGIEAAPVANLSAEARSYVASLNVEEIREATRRAINAETLRQQANKAALAPVPSRAATVFPSQGVVKGIAILVEYSDVEFTVDDPYTHFYNMLNEEGYSDFGGTGSARDYFISNSNGAFQPQFDVYGPVTLPHNRAYYGGNVGGSDQRPEQMAIHACQALDDIIDFSEYDFDKDGLIDNVFIYFAGYGEAVSGAPAECIWPHSWDIDYASGRYPAKDRTFDGKRLNHYACGNEIEYNPYGESAPDGIGTFVHEFSHVLGLPDLYCTDGSTHATPGLWSVLDQGCFNNSSRTPVGYSAYERYFLGWLDPIEVTEPMTLELYPITQSNSALKITSPANPDEYFLLETREQEGWDANIYGRGLLVWHIDYDYTSWMYNVVNNTANHLRVDIVRADKSSEYTAFSLSNDPFPGKGTSYKTLTSEKYPDYNFFTGTSSFGFGKEVDYPITNIIRALKSKGGYVSMDIAGGKEITGVEIVGDDSETAPVELFDLNGRPVSSTKPAPGLYLRRKGDKVEKISIR